MGRRFPNRRMPSLLYCVAMEWRRLASPAQSPSPLKLIHSAAGLSQVKAETLHMTAKVIQNAALRADAQKKSPPKTLPIQKKNITFAINNTHLNLTHQP